MAQRVLVVDDDSNIVRLVRSYLEQAGLTVLTATDGDTAMHAIRRERPDLIVLDLMLPGHDGWEITQWLRADPPFSRHSYFDADGQSGRYRQNSRSGTRRGRLSDQAV
ncbi:MAG TPA: response regulator [Phototrophicaceae bacterium]|nr:response regulator [Phototrophicaceae bacterium]